MQTKIYTKKERMYQRIAKHGEDLKVVFGLPSETDPVALCKKLHRLERKAHRIQEDDCNGYLQEDEAEKLEEPIKKSLKKIFGDKAAMIIFNGDPRGYTLKISTKTMEANRFSLYTDWGGYGIIAPEFNGD